MKLWKGVCAFEEGKKVVDGLTAEVITSMVRAYLPNTAAAIDAAENSWRTAPNMFAELIEAQQELAEANKAAAQICQTLEAKEEAERIRGQAVRTHAVLASAGKMSLAELRDALTQQT